MCSDDAQPGADPPSGDAPRGRLPVWLKRRLPASGQSGQVRQLLDDLRLATVCTQAHCPNQCECYARGTATFLILGETCTRNCGFCAVPSAPPGPPEADEPQRVAQAAERMKLRFVVITSVTRDDLPDGGAAHFAETIRQVRRRLPRARIEVLTPDFQGNTDALDQVIDARPDVFNHNVETVARLYPAIRPQADYPQSLGVLAYVRQQADAQGLAMLTKSGLMVGVGERDAEIFQTLGDLRTAGVDVLTIGQYLAPSGEHDPVGRFVPPEQFDAWARTARTMGFRSVAAGPFVRSSYLAEDVFDDAAGD